MTNYNDGNWHGWNGGECPVHPETVVQVQLANMTRMEALAQPASVHGPARQWIWEHEEPQDGTDIIAFRVVRAYREPREWWINEYPDDVIGNRWSMFDSEQKAIDYAQKHMTRRIHVREVLE